MMAKPGAESDDWFHYFLSPDKLATDLPRLSRTDLGRLICFFLSQGYQAFQTTQNHLMKERPPGSGTPVGTPDAVEHPSSAHEERLVSTHKADVMDILALKVAAQAEFDLLFLQESLPMALQDRLLRKLLQLATGIAKFDPFHDVGWPAWTPVGRFAHILFHRWSLKASVDIDFNSFRPSRADPINIVLPKGLTEIPPRVFEKGNAAVSHFVKANRTLSLDRLDPYLHRAGWDVAMPRPACFVHPRADGEETVEQQWTAAEAVSGPEVQALVAYDIGRFLFQERRFSRAGAAFAVVRACQERLGVAARAYLRPERVEAYVTACESFVAGRRAVPTARRQLQEIVERLAMEDVPGRKSQVTLSDDIVRTATNALLGDTLGRRGDLCRIERDDFEATLAPRWPTLHFAAVTCNLLHRVMAGQALLSLYAEKLGAQGDPGNAFLLSCLGRCLAEARESERLNLKCFAWYLLQALPDGADFAAALLSTEAVVAHFDVHEQAAVRQQAAGRGLAVAEDAFMELEEFEEEAEGDEDASDPWFVEEEYEEEDAVEAGPSGAAAVDAMRLLTSYDPEEIHSLIDRLLSSPSKAYSCVGLARLSDKWQVRPAALERLLIGLVGGGSVGFVYLYVLVAKAQLLKSLGEWEGAHHLLLSAERAVDGESAYRVLKLVRQEACLLNMQSFLARAALLGPAAGPAASSGAGEAELVQACKAALTAVRIDADAMASEEFVVTAVCFLLSTGQGAYLLDLWGSLGPPFAGIGALHLATILVRLGGAAEADELVRPGCRELWEFLSRCLPLTPPGAGPGGPGGAAGGSASAPLSRDALLLFLRQLRERWHLSLLLSALIAMCRQQLADLNILIYPGTKGVPDCWPSSGAAGLKVNQDALQEAVHALLDAALAKFPNECPWLLTRAELAFSQRHYKRALIAYLECGAAASDFFSLPVPDDLYSRQTLQRMLRCCEEMRYYGQAAVMCQLATNDQGETDYKSAVRFLKLQDESLDNVESYLPFVWDVTLLELVAAICGSRYGAVEKRAKIIATVARPELNMANKADVRHNVEAQRRLALLRLMCEQHFL